MSAFSVDSPIHEIRLRALHSLRSKLNKGLLSAQEFIQSDFLIRLARFWFIRDGSLPESSLALGLLRDLLRAFPELKDASREIGLRSVLSRWRLSIHGDDLEVLEILRHILEELIPPLEDEEEETSLTRIRESSASEDPSSTCLHSSLWPLTTLPSHLLFPASLSEESSSYYSPVRKHYFKRRVHFSQREEEEESQDDSINPQTPSFPWITLIKEDLQSLQPKESSAYKTGDTLELIVRLSRGLLHDFPPQTFLQRPDILSVLIHALSTSSEDNNALRTHILEAYRLFIQKIHQELSRGEPQAPSSFVSFRLSPHEVSFSDNEGQDSLDDRLAVLELKKEEISLLDTIWSLFDATLCLWEGGNERDEGTALMNVTYALQNSLLALLKDMGFHAHSKEGGRIYEIGRSLSELANAHFSRMSIRFHRLAYILLLKLSLEWTVLVNSLGMTVDMPEGLRELWRDAIYDPTLHLSHPKMHESLCSLMKETEFESKVKPLFQSIRHCVDFMKGRGASSSSSKESLLHAARHSVPSFPLHESQSYLVKFFELCSDSGHTDLHGPLLQLLKIKNLNLRTQVYLSLHSLVQGILGISHALNRFNPSDKFKFLVRSPGIFQMVLKTSLSPKVPQSLQMACQEIIIYLLKSEHILKGISIPSTVFLPNVIYFECLACPESLLGRLIFGAFNPDADLRTLSGLSKASILESNFRLLFHSSASLREAAQGNLKVLLAQEEDSCLKLPRFADIFNTDVSQAFISPSEEILNFRGISDSNQQSIGEFIVLMESFLYAEKAASGKLIQILRRLTVLLEEHAIRSKFLECGGMSKLMIVWARILQEDDYDAEPEVLPDLFRALKVLLIKEKRDKVLLNASSHYFLLRSMYLLHSPRLSKYLESRRDLSIIAALVLFKDALILDGTLKIDPIIRAHFILPFYHESMLDESYSPTLEENLQESKGFKLLKTCWNICWEGLGSICCSLSSENCSEFDGRLQLSPEERSLIGASFPVEILRHPSKLLHSQTPTTFLKELEALVSLRCVTDEDKELPMNYDKVFGRFLTLEPRGDTDLWVYDRILTYLKDHLQRDPSGLSNWVQRLLQSDGTILRLFMRELTSKKGSHIHQIVISTLSQFLMLFQMKPAGLTLLIRGIQNKEIHDDILSSHNLMWLFRFLKGQVRFFSLLDACDVSNFICESLRKTRVNGYLGSGSLIAMLTVLQKMVEKTLREGDFESLEIFGRLEWMIPLFNHRSLYVRALAFQITSLMALSELGADSLTRRLSESVSIWEIGLSIFMNESEALIVRQGALKTLSNLLDEGHELFYGPGIREDVSGIIIKGESALSSFLHKSKFEEFVTNILKAFGRMHRPKYESDEDTIKHIDSSAPSPLFVGEILYFLYVAPSRDMNSLSSSIDEHTEIDLSDSALKADIISRFHLEDYVFYLNSLICIHLKRHSVCTTPEGIRLLNAHLASTLFLRRKLTDLESLRHLTMNLFLLMHGVLSMDKIAPESKRSLCRMINKYEGGIFEGIKDLLLSGDERVKRSLLSYISVLLDFTTHQDKDRGECLSIKAEIFYSLSLLFHEALLKNDEEMIPCITYSLSSFCLHIPKLSSEADLKLTRSILSYLDKIVGNPPHRSKRKITHSLIVLLNNLCHVSKDVLRAYILREAHFSETLQRLLIDVEGITALSLLGTLSSSSSSCHEGSPPLFRNGKLLNTIIQLSSKGNTSALRILISHCADASESRSLLYKSSFLSVDISKGGSRVLYNALSPKNTKNKRSEELILILDLLLTVTSFPDGQQYVPSKAPEIMDYLLISLLKNKADILCLAILRNITFHPSNRARILLCKEFLGVLADILLDSVSLPPNIVEMAMQIIWSICHNSLKAKTTLREMGIQGILKDVVLLSSSHLKSTNESHISPSLLDNLKSVLLLCDK